MDQHLETIGAFFDGEHVDAAALKAALATEESRAYLVELAAMREVVAMPAFAAAPAARPHAGRFTSGSGWSAKFLVAAAVLFVMVGTTGFVLGRTRAGQIRNVQAEESKAPAPTREIPPEAAVESHSTIGGF